MSKITKPWLGQHVSARDSLIRWTAFNDELKVYEDVWTRRSDCHALAPCPVDGIYVGSRTKQNGYTDYYEDEGSVWHRTGSVEVWLIVVSDRKNPIFVLPQDCDFIPPTL